MHTIKHFFTAKQVRPFNPQWIALLGAFLLMWAGTASAFADDVAIAQPEQVTLTVQESMVVLSWVYTVDPGAPTYTLLRSENRNRANATIVQAALLSATGDGNPVLAYYTMIDASAQPGVAYAYWLTVADEQGGSATYGPFTSGQVDDASEQQHQLFLPLVAS